MAGLSITSALLSPINKLRGKSNPYQKSGNANRTSHPSDTPTSDDLLAEARQAAGRDPVTGQRTPGPASKKAKKQKMSLEQEQQAAEEQKAAFLAWAAKHPQAAGRPYESYEAFVREMVAKRTGNVAPSGRTEYYAPQQTVEEYYSTGLSEEARIVCLRFGNDYTPECMEMDEMLYKIVDAVKDWVAIYVVDNQAIPDFNAMYEIYDPCTVMFFWRNKHMQVDFGTGNNNKINFPIGTKQELIDILEAVYRGASKGKGLVVSPRDYSTKWAY
ncbi:unnamed protein product [Alternaria alternata]